MHKRARRTVASLGFAGLLVAGCTGQSATNDSSSAASSTGTSSSAAASTSSSSSSTAAPTSATTTGSAPADDVPAELTPVLARVDTEPVPVSGADGKVYLAYELYLTNILPTPATIDSVQVTDVDGAVLQTYSGADLVRQTRLVGAVPASTPPTSLELGGGQSGIVWLDPSVAGGSAVPTSLVHEVKITYPETPSPLFPLEVTERVAITAVSSVPAPTIASPLDGPNWLNGNGCCDLITPHRGASNPINGRYFFAERFAIDWVQLTSDLKLITGDVTQLSSYPYYGAPIHAVADGEIVAVSDVMPDQVPGANPPDGSLTLAEFGGNHVVERFEQNGQTYYALYAHLKSGTATAAVTVGQKVSAGDVVGDLGNSGNTDSPHLHFHVMDGPDPLASDGLPYQFDTMDLVGRAPDDSVIDALMKGQPMPTVPGSPTGERTDELPLDLDLVDLTVAGSSSTSSASGSSSIGSSSTVPSR